VCMIPGVMPSAFSAKQLDAAFETDTGNGNRCGNAREREKIGGYRFCLRPGWSRKALLEKVARLSQAIRIKTSGTRRQGPAEGSEAAQRKLSFVAGA
jgi:hypothetical protein